MTLDRFDRMLEASSSRAATPAPAPALAVRAYVMPEPAKPPRKNARYVPPAWVAQPRGPRFADYTMCPMCGTDREGLEYQGELRSGAKIHTIAAHTPNCRRVESGQPRCLGSGMRMVFVGGVWIGEPK